MSGYEKSGGHNPRRNRRIRQVKKKQCKKYFLNTEVTPEMLKKEKYDHPPGQRGRRPDCAANSRSGW